MYYILHPTFITYLFFPIPANYYMCVLLPKRLIRFPQVCAIFGGVYFPYNYPTLACTSFYTWSSWKGELPSFLKLYKTADSSYLVAHYW
jgi:hypothetical protein